MVKGGYFLQPPVYGLSRLNPQVVPLRLHIQGLNRDVRLNNAAVVRPIEPMVGLAVLWLKALNRSVNFEFDDGDGGSGNDGDVREVGLGGQYFVQVVEGGLNPKMLRNVLKVVEYFPFHSNIDVAVLNGYPARTTPEELYLNIIKTKQKLDSLESYQSPLVVQISLL